MKLKRMGMKWGPVLSTALLAACAGSAPPVNEPAVAPGETALTARLTALEARITALEQALAAKQALAAQRDRQLGQQAAVEKTLSRVQRELKASQAALTSLRRKVEALPSPAPVRREGVTLRRDAPSAVYRPVDVMLGELPGGNGERAARLIPAAIPNAAREILIYARVATGYVKGGPHRFRIATRLDNGQEAAFYLYAVGQPQQSWAYNSDNVWLPMPKNRELILQADGEPFFGDWNGEVRIIGYR